MPASNIHSVTLHKDGSVTVKGKFTDMANLEVKLFHVWLWQLGGGETKGAGLATSVPVKTDNTFEHKDTGAPDRVGRFRSGAATVSAIAVVSPTVPDGPTQEVLQWGRSLRLVEDNPA